MHLAALLTRFVAVWIGRRRCLRYCRCRHCFRHFDTIRCSCCGICIAISTPWQLLCLLYGFRAIGVITIIVVVVVVLCAQYADFFLIILHVQIFVVVCHYRWRRSNFCVASAAYLCLCEWMEGMDKKIRRKIGLQIMRYDDQVFLPLARWVRGRVHW